MNIQDALKLLEEQGIEWLKAFVLLLPNLFAALLIVIIAYLIARKMKGAVRIVTRRLISNQALISFLGTLSHIAVIVAGVLLAMRVLALDQAVLSVLAGIGIVGIALGFAFQDIAANFIAGIALVFRRNYPFKVGDVIETNDYFGKVEEINLRDTMLRTFDGKYIFIPNKLIFENAVTNHSAEGLRRVSVEVGVSYGENLEKVKETTVAAVKNLPQLLREKPVELFYEEFGGSSINLKLRFWVKYTSPKDYLSARSEAIMRIKDSYDNQDIAIPFPIRTLDFGIKGGVELKTMLESTGEEER